MPTPETSARPGAGPVPPCPETTATWHRLLTVFSSIGLLSFGGPAAQIALMHRKLVEETGWLSEKAYANALGFCMLLPGPEAMQLATYCGWKLRGISGGLAAGLLFVVPGAIAIFALAATYAAYGNVPLIDQLFLGIKAAILIVVLEALLRLSKRALTQRRHWVIAALAFVAIFFLSLPFPMIVLAAALYGMAFRPNRSVSAPEDAVQIKASSTRTLSLVAIGLLVWLGPLAVLDWGTGQPILGDLGWFFSKLAVVTFGGAYAVLAYMAQDVVTLHGWLSAGQMMDGLGLAETTPGPLILVTQFVGFVAAYQQGGSLLGLAGGLGRSLGDFHSLLLVDLRWRSLYRLDLGPAQTAIGAFRHYRCRGRRCAQSVGLVRSSCCFPDGHHGAAGLVDAMAAGSREPGLESARSGSGLCASVVPLPCEPDRHTDCSRALWRDPVASLVARKSVAAPMPAMLRLNKNWRACTLAGTSSKFRPETSHAAARFHQEVSRTGNPVSGRCRDIARHPVRCRAGCFLRFQERHGFAAPFPSRSVGDCPRRRNRVHD